MTEPTLFLPKKRPSSLSQSVSKRQVSAILTKKIHCFQKSADEPVDEVKVLLSKLNSLLGNKKWDDSELAKGFLQITNMFESRKSIEDFAIQDGSSAA
jgi:hypothetical protein